MNGSLLDVAAALTAPLLVAVLVVLAIMAGWVALLAGGFVRELGQRRTQREALERAVRLAAKGPRGADEVMAALASARSGLPARLAHEVGAHGLDAADRILHRLDARVRRLLGTHTLLTRLGPMAGLVATLLPLGPALSRLAEGDVAALADDLTVAFTATVAGLVVSCASFGMGLVRRGWYHDDLAELELVLLRVLPDDATTPIVGDPSPRDGGYPAAVSTRAERVRC